MPNDCREDVWLIQDYNSGSYLSSLSYGGTTFKWCRAPNKAIYYSSKIDASEEIVFLGINATPVEKPR